MVLYVRELAPREEAWLHDQERGDDADLKHRVQVVLLSAQGYRVPEIARLLDSHPANLRKWIHRFNADGCQGLVTVRAGGAKPRFTAEQKQRIISLARTQPRLLGLYYTSWTLHKLAREAVKREIVAQISHECVRQILQDAECDYHHELV